MDAFPIASRFETSESRNVPTNANGIPAFTYSSVNSSFIWVTGYFRAAASKHPNKEYVQWIQTFLKQFTAPLFFFTTSDQAAFYRSLAPNENVHYITKYKNIWEVPCVSGMKETYYNQRVMQNDPEGREEVYAIWNSKVCLVKEISDQFPNSIVFWMDCGSMREYRYRNMPFPNHDRLAELFPNGTTAGEMVFAMYEKTRLRRETPMALATSAWAIGGIFAGDHAAIDRFYTHFWAIHNKFAKENKFIGMEQIIFSTYLVYFGNSWVQPNYAALGCDRWFSTFSFYGDLRKCFWRNKAYLSPVSSYMVS